MQIFIYGDDARLLECRRLLEVADKGGAVSERVRDIHLLPIPSRKVCVDDLRSNLFRAPSVPSASSASSVSREALACEENPRENALFTDGASIHTSSDTSDDVDKETMPLPEQANRVNLLVGYEVPTFLYEIPSLQVFDLAQDEMFLRRNARLCALGTLGVILTEHTRVPSDLHIGVIGYGRIGKEVCDLLHFLETPLVVFTSKEDTVRTLTSMEIPSVLVDWTAENSINVNESLQKHGISRSIDILINTSPAPLGDAFYEGFVGTIYDLASGSPIPESVAHTRLSSLPMRMYAQSAGHAVYRAIVEEYNDFFDL
ncbi:MAG: hypothetical protein IKC72_07400 [Clostridia bacterium]|nr:hypothetical protein [Clostridia bacterium]